MRGSTKQQQRTLIAAAVDADKTLQDFICARLSLSRRGAKSLIDTRNVWESQGYGCKPYMRAAISDCAVYSDTVAQVKVPKLRC